MPSALHGPPILPPIEASPTPPSPELLPPGERTRDVGGEEPRSWVVRLVLVKAQEPAFEVQVCPAQRGQLRCPHPSRARIPYAASAPAVMNLLFSRRKRFSRRERLVLEGYILVCVAGHIAEKMYLGGRAAQVWNCESNEDRCNAEHAARQLGKRSPRGFVERQKVTARHIVQERWRAVRAVARALSERETVKRSRVLDERDLRSLVKRSA